MNQNTVEMSHFHRTVKMRISVKVDYPYKDDDYGPGVSMKEILQNEIDAVRISPIFFLQTIRSMEKGRINVDHVSTWVDNNGANKFEDVSFLFYDEDVSNDAEYAGSLEDDWSPLPLTDPVQLELDL